MAAQEDMDEIVTKEEFLAIALLMGWNPKPASKLWEEGTILYDIPLGFSTITINIMPNLPYVTFTNPRFINAFPPGIGEQLRKSELTILVEKTQKV